MIIPTDPKASYLEHRAEIDQAIHRVLDGGWYILGQEVDRFEAEFAAYVGVAHGVGVASGTDAIELALRATGIGPGDLVFTVSHTAVATVVAIERTGATPVLIDIDPTTYNLDANRLELTLAKLRNKSSLGRPTAIVPVHLYGLPADMPAIMDLARRHNLRVIEDCSQAHGARINDQVVGTFGCAAAFSLYPTKNLGAIGDAGIVVTSDHELGQKLRALREYGWTTRYVSEATGVNSRLDELQAAILRVKLPHLDRDNRRRQRLADTYHALLSGTTVSCPDVPSGRTHVYHQFVVRTPLRDALRAYLKDNGIGTLIHYPMPVHLQPAYRKRLPELDRLEQTEQAAREILSLPIYPQLNDGSIESVCQQITSWNPTVASGH